MISGSSADTAPALTAAASPSDPSHWWRRLLILALLAFFAVRCVPSVWRYDVLLDESAHLETWKNRISGDCVSPTILAKLQSTHRVSPRIRQQMVDLYMSHWWIRRALYAIVDSPCFSIPAEISASWTHSSLLALRLPSLLFTAASLVVLYALGVRLKDDVLGFWLCALFLASPLEQVYTGIGRAYALTTFGLVLLIYAFVCHQLRAAARSPWRVLLAALLVQGSHVAAWFLVFPFVLVTLIVWLRQCRGFGRFLGSTWWYAAGTGVLLAICALAATMGSAQNNLSFSWRKPLAYLGTASSFGQLTVLGATGHTVATIAFTVLVAAGIWMIACNRRWPLSLRVGLLAGLLFAGIGGFVACMAIRHILTELPIAMIVAGLGARSLFVPKNLNFLAILVLLVGTTVLSLAFPRTAYGWLLEGEAPTGKIAAYLKANLHADDAWVAMPYYRALPLYQYRPLPDPMLPLNDADFDKIMQNRTPWHSLLVLTESDVRQKFPVLRDCPDVKEFDGGVWVVHLPAPAGGN